jgi:hypothetical protein
MSTRRCFAALLALAAGVLMATAGGPAAAQPPGKGPPAGKGPQAGKGKAGDPAFAADRDGFHYLLEHRKDIRRTVKEVAGGVETLTESDDPAVAGKIREHVSAMHARVKTGNGVHYRDPLFAEIFRNYDKITMTVERTPKGAKVTETSADPYVAKLIQAHALVVTKFIENGHAEVMKNHPLPAAPAPKQP